MLEHPVVTVSYTKTLDLQMLSWLPCTMAANISKIQVHQGHVLFNYCALVCHSLHPSSSGVTSNVFTSAVELQSACINISLNFIRNLQYSNTTYVYTVLCDWNVEFSMWVEPWWKMLPPLSVKLPDDRSYFDTRSTWSRTISPVCISPRRWVNHCERAVHTMTLCKPL